ncbi:MAG: MBL fold metallo-hydrolase [Thermoplasmata archaeon]|uniref:MBL fold metallo-hydrolase n=1 Tax=Candidatus Sysuiplasma superficiale TaxID=2823368 RepID=A0A8J7YPJ7_9ARCH|nr:MBL fold metallo-hydrolase [Candidatus Sysuiplasma superficiale]MBX8644540.1 MBL fold metallo-hydrolase [Candidatus Sysuiplasma superficiale]MCL4347196.1 MBL fold metallo-hydrolase [Candidatus Thermoplasmatota archaeon]MCL5437252.1 MBL fold metallo-hydrolase [Candidatus Thermoplasmatota archaeon]
MVDLSKDLYFHQFVREETGCLSYLVGDLMTGDAIVIDPLQENAEEYLRVADAHAITINKALDTHSHADHFSALQNFKDKVDAELFMSEITPAAFDFTRLKDGSTITVGNVPLKVIYTPGHTPDHVSLVVAQRLLISGDSLFVGGVARPDLVLSETEDVRSRAGLLYDSVHRLLELDDYYELYPGHFAGSSCGAGLGHKSSSTIGFERRFNGTVQRSRKEEFVDFVVNTTYPPIPDYQLIKKYNLGLIERKPEVRSVS